MAGANRSIVEVGEFGRVAVALGGTSAERAVSLDGGQAVLDALKKKGVDTHSYDPAEMSFREFLDAGFDRVWNALHGPGGEDGVLQGALDWCGIAYTGSGVTASAIAMDKVRSKALFREAGMPTPRWRAIDAATDPRPHAAALGYPLIVKPVSQGSSVGMARVDDESRLREATRVAARVEDRILLEEWIDGEEYTVAVLDRQTLASIRIETPNIFYDYNAKYEADTTRYICPGLGEAEERRYRAAALDAFDLLGCSGWGRVDFITGRDGKPQLLEINTIPGMTSHSLVPMAARAEGMDFETLCWRILETSFSGQAGVRNGA